jgi:ribosomal protein L37E
MSGLKRRLTRRRAAEPESAAEPPAATASAAPAAEPSLLSDPAASAQSEGATEPLPITELPAAAEPAPATPALPGDDLPAGLDADELAAHPDSSARRSRLRRRIEFLRSARELLLRDLGGFDYELHRTARDTEHEGHRKLRAVKLTRLDAVETELRALEDRLHDPRRRVVVREPGVGGECHRCGELFGSDANYCAHCGAPLTESARKARQKAERARAAEAPAPERGPAGDAGAPKAGTGAEGTSAPAATGGSADDPAATAVSSPGAAGAADDTAATAVSSPGAAGAADETAATAVDGAPASGAATDDTTAAAAPDEDRQNGAAPDAPTRVLPEPAERGS